MLSHVISIPFITLNSTHLHFNCPSPHCSRAAEIFHFRLIRIHSNAVNFILCSSVPAAYYHPKISQTPPSLGAALKEYTRCTPRERNIKKRYIIILYPFYYQTHARMYACMYVSTFFKEGNAKQ